MPDFGLSPAALDSLKSAISRVPNVSAAAIFGSRAMGRHKPHSDIDIVLYGAVLLDDLAHVRAMLEELPIPQNCDVQAYGLIESAELRA